MLHFASKLNTRDREFASDDVLARGQSVDCTMCANAVARPDAAPWDTPIAVSRHFIAIPSLGALVPGWLLILPRRHFLNLARLPAGLQSELEKFTNEVIGCVADVYGQVIQFEHGPSAPNSAVGCSVDHAHLHVVPSTVDLRPIVSEILGEQLRWAPLKGGLFDKELRGTDSPYLFFSKDGDSWMAEHPTLGSQLFRRALASALNMDSEFNWRLNPQLQIVAQTIQDLSPSR
jgi:ATP adenylyltransferase